MAEPVRTGGVQVQDGRQLGGGGARGPAVTPVPGPWWYLLTAADEAPAGEFLQSQVGLFLLSPGFGGLAALVAAGLVCSASRQNASHARQEALRAREKDRQERWWEALTWIYDRASAERVEARSTTDLVLDLLERLHAEAVTDLEVQAVRGLIEAFQDLTEAA